LELRKSIRGNSIHSNIRRVIFREYLKEFQEFLLEIINLGSMMLYFKGIRQEYQ